MSGNFKHKITVAAIIVLVILAILGIGYFMAERQSRPQYLSKIDKLMYDRKNKSPKFIINLPAYKGKIAEKIKQPEAADKQVEGKVPENQEDYLQMLINNTPNLDKLPEIKIYTPLAKVEIDENFQTEEDGIKIPKTYNGKKPWVEYAAEPQEIQPNFHRIAVVVKNLGLDRRTTHAVIDKFPAEISLSFTPYASENQKLITDARSKGHETYIDLYLSSRDFLKSDSGPVSMSMTASDAENMSRLRQTVSVAAPIGGIVVNPGVSDENNRSRLEKLFTKVKEMGLLMLDATGEDGIDAVKVPKLPRQKADIVINSDYTREEINRKLMQAELISQNKGVAVVAVEPKPIVLIELDRWINGFSPQYTYEEMKEKNIKVIEKPYALVPLSVAVTE